MKRKRVIEAIPELSGENTDAEDNNQGASKRRLPLCSKYPSYEQNNEHVILSRQMIT
jgi:hypothetical protein